MLTSSSVEALWVVNNSRPARKSYCKEYVGSTSCVGGRMVARVLTAALIDFLKFSGFTTPPLYASPLDHQNDQKIKGKRLLKTMNIDDAKPRFITKWMVVVILR